jgi:type II secretory pathway component PulL
VLEDAAEPTVVEGPLALTVAWEAARLVLCTGAARCLVRATTGRLTGWWTGWEAGRITWAAATLWRGFPEFAKTIAATASAASTVAATATSAPPDRLRTLPVFSGSGRTALVGRGSSASLN